MLSTFVEGVRRLMSPRKKNNMEEFLFRRSDSEGKPVVFSATRQTYKEGDQGKVKD